MLSARASITFGAHRIHSYASGRLEEFRINVNAVSPDHGEGERFEERLRNRLAEQDPPVDETRSAMVAASSLQQLLSPEDVADPALFLCSEQSDRMIG